MTARDAGNLEEFLRQEGAPDMVVQGGLEMLLAGWERTVVAVEEGWAPEDNWWYFVKPLNGPAEFLAEFPPA